MTETAATTEKPKETTTAQQRLLLKLVAASVMVKAVQKDGENTFQRYTFQSEAAIKNVVKPALEANGLAIIPSFQLIDQRDEPGKRGTNHIVDVLGTFVITDGVASITGTMLGSGADTMEKAMAKACTSAQKYFYKQLFNISDKDTDPDADDSTRSTQPQQSSQQPQQEVTTGGVSITMLRTFLTTMEDAAHKRHFEPKEVAKVIFEQAGVSSKPWVKLTPAEFGRIDAALDKYIKG